ncbi:MAG TPA: SIS domain-containing protein [Vicinamibacterales bacterium]|nr:SIS domain-containing protein [Vicinamibacterales bacterium]
MHSENVDPLKPLPLLAQQYDRFNMQTVIRRLPDQIDTALAQALPSLPTGHFNKAVVSGLGGSALPADVLNDAFADEMSSPVRVWRQYGVPSGMDDSTLLIVSSFSGTTEETVSSLPKAARNVVVITAGAESPLARIAAERGYSLVLISTAGEPKGFQPRSAFGYIVTYLARILHGTGLMNDPTPTLQRLAVSLRAQNVRSRAEEVAAWLADRIPIVYTDESHYLSVARVAKIKFNENGKRASFFNAFPELNHNEMIGFMAPLGKFAVLYLHDPTSHPRIRERYEVMKKVFATEGLHHVSFMEWEMPGDSRAERVFSAVMFADWCSYATALLDGFDPTPVALVENFKQLLTSTYGSVDERVTHR